MLFRKLCLVVLSTSCTTFKSDSDTGNTSAGVYGGYESVDDSIQSHGGLQDLTQGLDKTGCDIQEATDAEIPGAASYYYGLFVQDGATYSGYEQWLIYANATWRGQGYSDCTIQWTASATEGTPGAATSANFALDVTLTLDRNSSTCPDELMLDLNDTDVVHYDIQISGTQSSWFFASGNNLGSGHANDNALNYLSPKSCRWF
mgnify:CR=1 FL=1